MCRPSQTPHLTLFFIQVSQSHEELLYTPMNAWLPQASYPCGNFSDTSSVNIRLTKGSLDHSFEARIHTENTGQTSICSYAPREISVLTELILGHLCYCLTDVPPQPNSPPDSVLAEHHAVFHV